MDDNFLKYYEAELLHIRDMGRLFAKEYPKIAAKLDLDSFECADPFVERLLEGFAFISARIQQRMDAEYPRFIESLLEVLLPHYLAPIPSMMIARFSPDLSEGDLESGFTIPRGTSLRSQLNKQGHTSCIYKTARELCLWPLKINEFQYHIQDLSRYNIPPSCKARAAVRIQLEITTEANFMELENFDELVFYLNSPNDAANKLYEQIFANALGVFIQDSGYPIEWQKQKAADIISAVGFDNNQALLPVSPRIFQGYRLLQEYFAFPERFCFFKISGLAASLKSCQDNKINIIIPFSESVIRLEQQLKLNNIQLNCSPAINLFEKETDRCKLDAKHFEHHLVVDRTRPIDYEIHSVLSVKAYGHRFGEEYNFYPFYSTSDVSKRHNDAYFTCRRSSRLLSVHEQKIGPRSDYLGVDTFLALVDANQAPYGSQINEVSVQTLCTNRDIPLQLKANADTVSFVMDINAPVETIRPLGQISAPVLAKVDMGSLNWRLISHLSKNYTTIINTEKHQASQSLRELLSLYVNKNSLQQLKQIEGIKEIKSASIIHKLKSQGRMSFVRGLEITIIVDERAFTGFGSFILGSVLERFLQKYVSINSFTQTVLQSEDGGVIKKWPAKTGNHQLL